MKTIKVYIEIADNGYSAYMEKNDLNYGLIGEGKTVRETIADFMDAYAEMREYYPPTASSSRKPNSSSSTTSQAFWKNTAAPSASPASNA